MVPEALGAEVGSGGPGTWRWVWGLGFQSGAEDLRVRSGSLGKLGVWDYCFGVAQGLTVILGRGWRGGPSLTLWGCAEAGYPAEGVADAGPPPLDSEAAPGSVVPPPPKWAPLFAEPEPAPVG